MNTIVINVKCDFLEKDKKYKGFLPLKESRLIEQS